MQISSIEKTKMLVVIVVLVLNCPLCFSSYLNRTRSWKLDMEDSIKRNFVLKPVSTCRITRCSTFKQLLQSNTSISVLAQFPSLSEVSSYQRLPNTLEAANKDLHRLAVKQGYSTEWQGINETRWVIPTDHPGQEKIKFMAIAREISNGRVLDLYGSYKTSIQGAMYLVKVRKGVIHYTGSVGLQCGYYIGIDGCETRWNMSAVWWKMCTKGIAEQNLTWTASSDSQRRVRLLQTLKKCSLKGSVHDRLSNYHHLYEPKMHRRVFVATALWDYNYNHFLTDCLARIIRNIRFLRVNKDVKIHIRQFEEYDTLPRDEKFKTIARRMRDKLFSLLDIDASRIVSGVVVADEVFIPRNTHCAYALKNPLEIRLLKRELLLSAAVKSYRPDILHPHLALQSKPVMIIQQRYTQYSSGDRTWSDATMLRVAEAFASAYSDYEIVTMNSTSIEAVDYCLECEILEYARASILVGAHGAGLTNMMFMSPGSLVVEIAGNVQDVSMPWCGYYGPTAAIFGHNHYVYGYDHSSQTLNSTDAAIKSYNFFQTLE